MPPVKRLENIFTAQHRSDPERRYHTVDLYAIWCAKSFMLNHSAELNPFQTKYFLWIDAGAFRDSRYRFTQWPDAQRVRDIFKNEDKLLLGLINPLRRRYCTSNNSSVKYNLEVGPIKQDLIEGGFIAGNKNIIQWWTNLFYETLDAFVRKGHFIGKDQYAMNAIALSHPHLIKGMLSFRFPCANAWFAFGPILANQTDRAQWFGKRKDCNVENVTAVVLPMSSVCFDSKNVV
ncbi:unnamed protein product [Didymodactylos carnosus]|uniref:Uncharacterized protein n=1 Tax=Didymodactylos carnosus TaxID=1234261 RepID=A0A815A4B0_9BILA|nr:unnamed protein product [Didymodactylos carnosus]CAF4019191.1 unnamed protein product [Didymodactylos carnosus]